MEAAAHVGSNGGGLILCCVLMVRRALWTAERAGGGHSVLQDDLEWSGLRVVLTRRARTGDSEPGSPVREQEGAGQPGDPINT